MCVCVGGGGGHLSSYLPLQLKVRKFAFPFVHNVLSFNRQRVNHLLSFVCKLSHENTRENQLKINDNAKATVDVKSFKVDCSDNEERSGHARLKKKKKIKAEKAYLESYPGRMEGHSWCLLKFQFSKEKKN